MNCPNCREEMISGQAKRLGGAPITCLRNEKGFMCFNCGTYIEEEKEEANHGRDQAPAISVSQAMGKQ